VRGNGVRQRERVRRSVIYSVASALLVGILSMTSAAGSTEPPPDDYTVEEFVGLAQSVFPEISAETATCIGEIVVPALSQQDLTLLFGDRQAPLKSGPRERAVLTEAIDECVDRPTAVEVVAGWAQSTLDADRLVPSEPVSLPYESLRCIDDALGAFSPGETFLSMYRRPASFMEKAATAISQCLEPDRLAEMISSWADGNAIPRINPAAGEEYAPVDELGSFCLRSVLVATDDDSELRTTFQQILLAASPDQLDHRLVSLRERVADCGVALSRNFGR
jgi:hypothetical protein